MSRVVLNLQWKTLVSGRWMYRVWGAVRERERKRQGNSQPVNLKEKSKMK